MVDAHAYLLAFGMQATRIGWIEGVALRPDVLQTHRPFRSPLRRVVRV